MTIPACTRRSAESVPMPQRHPGLWLDKYTIPRKQEEQKAQMEPVISARGLAADFDATAKRWARALDGVKGLVKFSASTAGPFTLHLSRAGALENAGICLHPIHGFAYLPGSGLKGMARAFAETVWLDSRPNKEQAWEKIEDIFGWGPNDDRKKHLRDSRHPCHKRIVGDREITEHSGSVVFLDAWPKAWPELVMDICNCHHPKYYGEGYEPGDWENPIPVNFFAVKFGTAFDFALAPRTTVTDEKLLRLARSFLAGALTHLGAGAKTAAGYGRFKLSDTELSREVERLWGESKYWQSKSYGLTLVTPAFLAGPNQNQNDCELRPATLRGQLRWWWRSLYRDWMDPKVLQALEGLIWGDTKRAGAVTIAVSPTNVRPVQFDYRDRFRVKDSFAHEKSLQNPQFGFSPGIFFMSYGMNDGGGKPARFYIPAGALWTVELSAKPVAVSARDTHSEAMGASNGVALSAAQVLKQAEAALSMLTTYGGVGSKARRGYGSIQTPNPMTLEDCESASIELQELLKLQGQAGLLVLEPISLEAKPGMNEWQVIDCLGFAYQSFCKANKHKELKVALGLPRKIHGPMRTPLGHQKTHTPPKDLECSMGERHASPLVFHVGKQGDRYTVTALAFISKYLPDEEQSEAVLGDALSAIEQNWQEFVERYRTQAGNQQGGYRPNR